MRSLRAPLRLAPLAAALALWLLTVPALAQQNCGNDKPVGNAQHCKADLPLLASTPELSSLLLAGGGLAGLGGYALVRLRASRRPG